MDELDYTVGFRAEFEQLVVEDLVLVLTLDLTVEREVELALVFVGELDQHDCIVDVAHPLAVEPAASEVGVLDTQCQVRGDAVLEFLAVDLVYDVEHV